MRPNWLPRTGSGLPPASERNVVPLLDARDPQPEPLEFDLGPAWWRFVDRHGFVLSIALVALVGWLCSVWPWGFGT